VDLLWLWNLRYEQDQPDHVGVYSASLPLIREVWQNDGSDKMATMHPDTKAGFTGKVLTDFVGG
jgi:hypothetical protein